MRKYKFHIVRAMLTNVMFIASLTFVTPAIATDQAGNLTADFSEDQPSLKNQSLDDVMSGFEDDTIETPKKTPSDGQDSGIHLEGYLKASAAINVAHGAPDDTETDWRGLSKLRSEAQIDVLSKLPKDWKLLCSGKVFYDAVYALRSTDDFTDEVIDDYEFEAELREIYLQRNLGEHLDFKAGRQIVVWGRSDNLRVTDVLNPLDIREPGLTDIEDLRLPVAMTRLDGYYGLWSLTGIAIHEIRFNKNPGFGSDFFPSPSPLPPEDVPQPDSENIEWAAALNGVFSGKDISIYWAKLFDDTAHVEMDSDGAMIQKHARLTMWGAAGNLALGNWLLKSEAAIWRGLKFFNSGSGTQQRVDALFGLEYSGLNDTMIGLDLAVRHLVDFDDRLKSAPDFAQEDEITSALRITRTWLNETVTLTVLALIHGPLGQDGALVRTSVEYDWSDSTSVLLGTALYHSGDKYAFRDIGENDRIFAELKYSF